MTEEEALELLRDAHREPIAEAHFAAVRQRVLSQLEGQRRKWRGAWALALAALATAAVCFVYWPKGPASFGEPPAPKVAAVEPAPIAAPAPPAVRPAIHKHRRAQIAVNAINRVVGPQISQPLVVKIVTDDPNVVIYWIPQGTGE